MNKLELLNKAVEMGARIDVKFHSVKSKDSAVAIMEQLANTYKADSSQGTHWLTHYGNGVEVTVYYEDSKENKIRQLEDELRKLKGE